MSTATKQALHVFRFDFNRGSTLPEMLNHTPELSAGLESFLKQRGYSLLPSLSERLETFESKSLDTADKYAIIARYPDKVFVIFCNNNLDYCKFMREHIGTFSVWPELFLPAPAKPIDNVIHAPRMR